MFCITVFNMEGKVVIFEDPYIQQYLGSIKCSNLCTEIGENSAPNKVAIFNLISIDVNMSAKPDETYDSEKLKHVAKDATMKLNKKNLKPKVFEKLPNGDANTNAETDEEVPGNHKIEVTLMSTTGGLVLHY